jgi:hypothetical protein
MLVVAHGRVAHDGTDGSPDCTCRQYMGVFRGHDGREFIFILQASNNLVWRLRACRR